MSHSRKPTLRYSRPPGGGVFFFFTDPSTAEEIAANGFANSDAWDPRSTVSLLDRIPPHMKGGILRVSLPAQEADEAVRLEASDHGEGYRRFLVPMALLKNAFVTLVTTNGNAEESPDGPSAEQPSSL